MTLLFAAVMLVAYNLGIGSLFSTAQELTGATLGVIFLLLLANGLAAALRLKVIAGHLGYRATFSQALCAVGSGSLAGAAFFQLAGQLMARGAVMGRVGISFPSVVIITIYERAIAAVTSALLALAGAYFIFGRIYVDPASGGNDLIKIMSGIFLATLAGALFCYGNAAMRAVAPALNTRVAVRIAVAAMLSLVVQLPVMAAYVLAARSLSPLTPVTDLIAASTIVMFAASIPISLAGWGVREMSAVVTLGTIGVASSSALVAAAAIGIISLAAMALFALLALPLWARAPQPPLQAGRTVDYSSALYWAVAVGAATLVVFQIYVPITSGTLLNVNLADPLAILGGSLFVLGAVNARRLPVWRYGHLNLAVALATVVLTMALIVGIFRIGWTEWAWVNRYLGWYVLLGYAATGALIVTRFGEEGLRTILVTYSLAIAAVGALELFLMLLHNSSILTALPVAPGHLSGFSQNPNFFAFQILMALCAVLAAERRRLARLIVMSVLISALFYSGSRSGWVTAPFILAAAVYLRAATVSEIGKVVLAAASVAALNLLVTLASGVDVTATLPQLVPTPENHAERLLSIVKGFELFLSNPVFGAGLGAFRTLGYYATSGIPLLIHSTYLWLLAEAGVFGFLIFLVPAAHILFTELRWGGADIAGKTIAMCLIAFAAMSVPADMLYQRTLWLLLGASLALSVGRAQAATHLPRG